MMEVFVKITSTSLFDFAKFKLSYKNFCVLMENNYIFQHVLLKEFPINWCTNDKVLSFLKCCKESGNPDVLL